MNYQRYTTLNINTTVLSLEGGGVIGEANPAAIGTLWKEILPHFDVARPLVANKLQAVEK
jgi:hypothetical protein